VPRPVPVLSRDDAHADTVALRKFNADEMAKGYPSRERIAATLRSGLGIDDARLKEALAAHLTARLDDMDAAIQRAEDALFGTLPEFTPSGPWRQAVVHIAQWKDEELPASFDELLAAQVRYRESDLGSWRQQVAGLGEVVGRLALFAAFADIEDAFEPFEPFEQQVIALDQRLDREIQREVDMRRGK
jgi:hypothetical protein